MLEIRNNTTLNGTCYVEKMDEISNMSNRILVASMYATVSDDGSNISVNKNIQNKEVYLANKETCDLEMAEFEEKAFALIK